MTDNKLDIEAGKRLRECRKAKGMTINQLAALAEINRLSIIRYEHGSPSLRSKRQNSRARQLAKILNVSADYLQLKSDYAERQDVTKEYWDYLERLRRSGITNMYGAAPYLAIKFGLSNSEAIKVLFDWMQNYNPDDYKEE